MSKDLRNQIPIGCAVNVAIINDLSKTSAFKDACIKTPLKYNIIPPTPNVEWPFFNLSWSAYMMYCMFVVAREIYNIGKSDSYFQQLIEKDVFRSFEILKQKESFNDDPLYNFKSIRNSVSHVNYKVNSEEIEMWDHLPNKSQPEDWHWHVKISFSNFFEFLGLVNEANFKFYNEIKSKIRNNDGIKIK